VKVAFVTPRYGENVIGGAEAAARALAEHLVTDLGHEVEIYTTCALEYTTWADELTPGAERVNGVTVHRFLSDSGRNITDEALDRELWASPRSATYEEAVRWIKMCGPVTTELLAALEQSDADVVVFYPYLYYMTVFGVARVRQPAVLHPAAHDEPALYLVPFMDVFATADALAFHTVAERELVERTMPIAGSPQIVLGVGVDPPLERQRPGGDVAGVGDRPYIVCVGRVDAQKGAVMLAEFFLEYKRRHPSDLALVFVGPVAAAIPEDPDIITTGVVSQQDRWDIVRDARVLVSPSAMESFSLVILEAWQVEVPVMVNASCAPTVEHCELSGGGLAFDSYGSFDAIVTRLLGDEALSRDLGRAGRAYVDERYAWPVLIRRYEAFLEDVIARGRTMPSLENPLRSPYLV
jgi:glycosyltransferase involved in cell wall biosynthesis